MLLELQTLSERLKSFGVIPEPEHPWVKPLSKGPFLVGFIDKAGTIKAIELRSGSDAVHVPKIQKDNQNSFPTFKLVTPILQFNGNDALRARLADKKLNQGQRATLIRSEQHSETAENAKKNRKRLRDCQRFAAILQPNLRLAADQEDGLRIVLEVLGRQTILWPAFQRQLVDRLFDAMTEDGTGMAESLLIGPFGKQAAKVVEVPIIFDAAQTLYDDFIPVADRRMAVQYSRALLQEASGEANGVCSLTGQPALLERGILPSPRLPMLADTILFSSNPDIPCLERYGLSGSNVYPVGRDTARTLHDAVRWMTSAGQQHKTWTAVPRSDDSGRDLLLAYIDRMPVFDAETAELMAGRDARSAASDFVERSQKLSEAIEKFRGKLDREAVMQVTVLRRISKGQVQVELSRSYKVSRFVEALREWRLAGVNAPSFRLALPQGKGKPTVLQENLTLFPAELVQLTKQHWIRGGTKAQEVIGISLSDAYDVFLDEGRRRDELSRYLLERIVQGYASLLLHAGVQYALYGQSVNDMDYGQRLTVLRAVSGLAIGLFKKGHFKEKYMENAAFRLGQVLQLSDTLHKQYCLVVRGGNLPPQLLGNQLFPLTADRPKRGLDLLSQRLRVYQGWANTAKNDPSKKQEGDKSPIGLAKWVLGQLGEVCQGLSEILPEGLDEAGRAEMFLGYLARRGGKELTDDKQ